MALKWPDKDPEEILDYPLDFTDWLASLGGAALDSVLITLDGVSTPSGDTALVIDQELVASPNIVAWLSLGTANETYTLKVIATDDTVPPNHRTVVRRVKIKVKNK